MRQARDADRAQLLSIRKPDLEHALWVGQDYTHVAVEHAQLRVVARDHDRATGKPLALRLQPPGIGQRFLHRGIERGGAPLALVHGAQNAKTVKRPQHATHPGGMWVLW